jgi:hypothetical protein
VVGAGTIISPIIKVVTTVAILAGVYLLIVRPILDTTEDITKGVNENIARSQQQSNQAAAAAQPQATEAEVSSTRQSATSYANSLIAGSQPWPKASKAVLHCVKQAGDNLPKLERCEALGQGITSGTLSDRNFATSYAESLASQGRTADAERVRSCIEQAGFEEKAMEKCRALADALLFG